MTSLSGVVFGKIDFFGDYSTASELCDENTMNFFTTMSPVLVYR